MIDANIFTGLYGLSDAAIIMMKQYYNAAYDILKTKYRKPKSNEVLDVAYRLMEIQGLIANYIRSELQTNPPCGGNTGCECSSADQTTEADIDDDEMITFTTNG